MKSRRYFLKEGALAATALLVSKQLITFAGGRSSFPFLNTGSNTITLLHTNDLHNHLQPLTHDIYSRAGGFEKTTEIISAIKSKTNNVVLVDAGDIFCGDISCQKEHETTLRMMRAAGYDAALPGNRDYEAGTDYLLAQWGGNNIPLVASNYSFHDNSLKNLHQPYKIIQKGNIKTGIIGAGIDLTGLTPASVNDKVQYSNPVNELTSIATLLKEKEKCQLVICLSHLGYKNSNEMDDVTLAAHSKNIDVIIGGHSHTFMEAPHIVLNRDQKEVVINHAGYGGIVLGNMNISFDDTGNMSQLTFNNLMIGAKDNKWIKKQHEPLTIS